LTLKNFAKLRQVHKKFNFQKNVFLNEIVFLPFFLTKNKISELQVLNYKTFRRLFMFPSSIKILELGA
jgi:hypothetical protein